MHRNTSLKQFNASGRVTALVVNLGRFLVRLYLMPDPGDNSHAVRSRQRGEIHICMLSLVRKVWRVWQVKLLRLSSIQLWLTPFRWMRTDYSRQTKGVIPEIGCLLFLLFIWAFVVDFFGYFIPTLPCKWWHFSSPELVALMVNNERVMARGLRSPAWCDPHGYIFLAPSHKSKASVCSLSFITNSTCIQGLPKANYMTNWPNVSEPVPVWL